MRTHRRSPRSSSGSTDCRSRWSSQRAGSACSIPRRWPNGSRIGCRCCGAGLATSQNVTARSTGRSDGATRCSNPTSSRLFARLSVFVGGWTLDAAEAVCGGDDIDVLEGLGTLVDDSLVRRRELADGSLRFWMLETIREFAWERLEEAGEVRMLRERHGRHYKSLAERVSVALEGRRGDWLELLDAELENLRAALSWFHDRSDYEALQAIAGSLGHYWLDRGLLSEMRTWLERSLESGAKGGHHALVLTRLSGVDYVQGRYEDARTRAQDALAEARSMGDPASVQPPTAHLANAVEARVPSKSRGTSRGRRVEIVRPASRVSTRGCCW